MSFSNDMSLIRNPAEGRSVEVSAACINFQWRRWVATRNTSTASLPHGGKRHRTKAVYIYARATVNRRPLAARAAVASRRVSVRQRRSVFRTGLAVLLKIVEVILRPLVLGQRTTYARAYFAYHVVSLPERKPHVTILVGRH